MPMWSSRRWALLERIRAEWGRPCERQRDMEAIASFFRASGDTNASDDRTWDDLLLEDVFARLDRTESRLGQQVLYRRLRSAPAPRSLDAFDALIETVSVLDRREAIQTALARLHDPAAYYIHRLPPPH